MKKGSMEVGVNFLVITIICLALLGIGIWLMSKFIGIGEKQLGKVEEYNKQQLQKALDQGALVATFPSNELIKRGEMAEFSVGISNELGEAHDFYIYVKQRDTTFLPVEPTYSKAPLHIENNRQAYALVGITMPKETPKGSYVYNIYVCKDSGGCSELPPYNDPYTDKYGELQQVQINVR